MVAEAAAEAPEALVAATAAAAAAGSSSSVFLSPIGAAALLALGFLGVQMMTPSRTEADTSISSA